MDILDIGHFYWNVYSQVSKLASKLNVCEIHQWLRGKLSEVESWSLNFQIHLVSMIDALGKWCNIHSHNSVCRYSNTVTSLCSFGSLAYFSAWYYQKCILIMQKASTNIGMIAPNIIFRSTVFYQLDCIIVCIIQSHEKRDFL